MLATIAKNADADASPQAEWWLVLPAFCVCLPLPLMAARASLVRGGWQLLEASPLTVAQTQQPFAGPPHSVTVYLIRHAQSMANVAAAEGDESAADRALRDALITEAGAAQAAALQAVDWRALGVERALSSPMRRCLQTACLAFAAAEPPLRVEVTPSAAEFFPHLMEARGTPVAELRTDPALLSLPRFASAVDFGELELPETQNWWSHEECARIERVDDLMRVAGTVAEEAAGRSTAVCCHWGVFNHLLLPDELRPVHRVPAVNSVSL